MLHSAYACLGTAHVQHQYIIEIMQNELLVQATSCSMRWGHVCVHDVRLGCKTCTLSTIEVYTE